MALEMEFIRRTLHDDLSLSMYDQNLFSINVGLAKKWACDQIVRGEGGVCVEGGVGCGGEAPGWNVTDDDLKKQRTKPWTGTCS